MPDQARARFRATVHYDGTAFRGWQIQAEGRTVQQVVEAALERLLDVPTRIDAAGRTDAGVHAAGQEIAFHAPARWAAPELRRGLNALVADDVWIEQVTPAADDFHPRFDATGRRYEYLVGTSEDARSPLRRTRIWALAHEVDEEALRSVTRLIPGERSFGAFARAGQPERGTRCRVEEATWWRNSLDDLVFRIVADRFLHRMVRYLVATLVEVGTGRREPGELRSLLAEEETVRAPSPAPACGLYLTGVRYADGWNRPGGVPGVPGRSEDDPGSGRSEPQTLRDR